MNNTICFFDTWDINDIAKGISSNPFHVRRDLELYSYSDMISDPG